MFPANVGVDTRKNTPGFAADAALHVHTPTRSSQLQKEDPQELKKIIEICTICEDASVHCNTDRIGDDNLAHHQRIST